MLVEVFKLLDRQAKVDQIQLRVSIVHIFEAIFSTGHIFADAEAKDILIGLGETIKYRSP
jgi:hypothetical protein